MRLSPFRSVFSKLFASVMLALILFAIAMVLLTKVLQDNNNSVRSEILAAQVVEQVNPFLYDLNAAPNRLQSRFMLAVIKKSFDIFDQSLDAKMGLYDTKGRLLIQTDGSDLAKLLPTPPSWFARTFPTLAGVAPTANARVFSPAGYTIFFEPRRSPEYNAITAMFNLFTGTLLLLVMMTIALWWIAHSMTWRINHMSGQMQQLGEGDFSARVTVSGNDEITSLATGFNQSAEKIEKLIDANNLLLAHASHEFRTPITRIRLQIEMMDMLASKLDNTNKQKFEKRANAITRDLTGLNDLVESILLVSRLDAGHALQKPEKIELYDLAHQEIQHFPQATLYGEHVTIQGQSKLLTHLIRNLLNNAIIHGISPVTVFLYGTSLEESANIPCSLLASSLENMTSNNTELVFADDTQAQLLTRTISDEDDNNQPVSLDHLETKKESTLDSTNINNDDMVDKNSLTKQSQSFRSRAERIKKFTIKPKVRPNKIHKYVSIAVIDKGNGIPLEKRESIFSPFVRLQQEKKGSGLGLSLVAQIVESHNGTIVTDTWQGYTRFLIVLPTKTN